METPGTMFPWVSKARSGMFWSVELRKPSTLTAATTSTTLSTRVCGPDKVTVAGFGVGVPAWNPSARLPVSSTCTASDCVGQMVD